MSTIPNVPYRLQFSVEVPGTREQVWQAVATAKDRTDLPGNLWYALWDKKNTTTSDWPWGKTQYTPHSRAHQYMVNSKEKRGSYTITVDRDAWDAPVAITG